MEVVNQKKRLQTFGFVHHLQSKWTETDESTLTSKVRGVLVKVRYLGEEEAEVECKHAGIREKIARMVRGLRIADPIDRRMHEGEFVNHYPRGEERVVIGKTAEGLARTHGVVLEEIPYEDLDPVWIWPGGGVLADDIALMLRESFCAPTLERTPDGQWSWPGKVWRVKYNSPPRG